MFWETNLIITLPIFLTYICNFSSSKKVQLLPIVASGIVLASAVITWLVYPPAHEITKSIGFRALAALTCSVLTRELLKEVNRIKGLDK